jgi:PleD family two-component response regulator
MLRRLFGREDAPDHDALVNKASSEAEQGRRLAMYDRLTGLFAHWYVRQRFDEEAKRATRGERQMSVLLIEGKSGGSFDPTDELVDWLRRKVRPYDLPAHLGGGSFLLVMPETSPEDAEKVAARIHSEISGAHSSITVYPDDALTLDELEDLARNRLAA